MRGRTPLEGLDYLVWNVVNLNRAHARLSIALGVVDVTASSTPWKRRSKGDIQGMSRPRVIPIHSSGPLGVHEPARAYTSGSPSMSIGLTLLPSFAWRSICDLATSVCRRASSGRSAWLVSLSVRKSVLAMPLPSAMAA